MRIDTGAARRVRNFYGADVNVYRMLVLFVDREYITQKTENRIEELRAIAEKKGGRTYMICDARGHLIERGLLNGGEQ